MTNLQVDDIYFANGFIICVVLRASISMAKDSCILLDQNVS